MTEKTMEQLHGTVESVVFASEESGFTVFELASDNELVTVVGSLPELSVGEEVLLTGFYGTHPTYGYQFRAELCERTLPATAGAIFKYLSGGAIKGIGPRTARRIVDRFGDETLEIIEKHHNKLTEIKGISSAKAKDINEQYRHIFGIRHVMAALSRYGIEAAAAVRVWKHWGELALEVIERDPYQLCCEAVDIPFPEADGIAEALGFAPDHPVRVRAGLLYVLDHNLLNGHTCLPREKLLEVAAAQLGLERLLCEESLEECLETDQLLSDVAEGVRYIYLPELYEAETYVAGRLQLMLGTVPPEPKSFHREIDRLEERLGLTYADRQRGAIQMALTSRVFILTGGPGTGKTTTLNAILELLEETGEKVALAAPTGRAAKRMSEICGRDAKTIHRLLEVDYREEGSSRIKFKRGEKNLLRADCIILDEVSMVDIRLMHSLLQAMKLSCRLILVGDADQLPSVGAGNLLRDLIASDVIPTIHLDEIFRQARQSRIVVGSHQIVKGEVPDLKTRDSDFFFLKGSTSEGVIDKVLDLCATRLPKAYGLSPMWDIQVVAPTRKGALGTLELNRRLQARLNPPDPARVEYRFGQVTFREQDKVMQIKNNYDIVWRRDEGGQGTGIFNGDIGVIEMIDRPSQTILVRYDDRVAEYRFDMADEIEHAWAVTVHKSQGSEFDAVVMVLGFYNRLSHYRNILYTAVTRAKKLMILIGTPDVVEGMVHNDKKTLRYTNLRSYLRQSILGEAEGEIRE